MSDNRLRPASLLRPLPVFAVAAFAMLTAGAAFAQPQAGTVFHSYIEGRPLYGLGQQAEPSPFSQGGTCRKWCLADVTPCDPDSYKVADRRCNVNQNGIFP